MDFSNPAALIREVFASRAAASGSDYDPSWVDAVPGAFLSALRAQGEGSLARAPLVTASSLRARALPAGSLVRYVGLVQDCFDPEWYAAVAAGAGGALAPCAFSDAPPPAESGGGGGGGDGGGGRSAALRYDLLERRLPLYLVPLPGESRWSRDAAAQLGGGGGGEPARATKRALGEGDGGAADGGERERGGGSPVPVEGPAPHPLVYEAEVPALARVYGATEDLGVALRVGAAVEVLAVYAGAPAEGGDRGGEEEAAAASGALLGGDAWVAEELARMRVARDPPAWVPRLHVVLVRPLAPSFPTLQPPALGGGGGNDPWALRSPNAPAPVALPGGGGGGAAAPAADAAVRARQAAATARDALAAAAAALATPLPPLPPHARAFAGRALTDVRAELCAALAATLGGDALAAEWLLLALLSTVSARRGEGEAPLGKLSLTVGGFPHGGGVGGGRWGGGAQAPHAAAAAAGGGGGGGGSGGGAPAAAPPPPPVLPLPLGASPAVRRLHATLSLLLPRVTLLPLRLQNLNGLRFSPRKDVDNDRLMPGVLQLAAGTPVLVDETVLDEGAVRLLRAPFFSPPPPLRARSPTPTRARPPARPPTRATAHTAGRLKLGGAEVRGGGVRAAVRFCVPHGQVGGGLSRGGCVNRPRLAGAHGRDGAAKRGGAGGAGRRRAAAHAAAAAAVPCRCARVPSLRARGRVPHGRRRRGVGGGGAGGCARRGRRGERRGHAPLAGDGAPAGAEPRRERALARAVGGSTRAGRGARRARAAAATAASRRCRAPRHARARRLRGGRHGVVHLEMSFVCIAKG
jgi:hypothetical protein